MQSHQQILYKAKFCCLVVRRRFFTKQPHLFQKNIKFDKNLLKNNKSFSCLLNISNLFESFNPALKKLCVYVFEPKFSL